MRHFASSALCLALSAGIGTMSPTVGQTPDEVEAEPIVKLAPGETEIEGQCLTGEELALIRDLDALTRPTVGVEGKDGGDDPAPFDPHYFVGTWEIEGVLPASPLGAAGEFAGTETVVHKGSCSYESRIEATLDGEPVSIEARMVYDRRASYMVRTEDDSRGFELLKMGLLGGDPGGYFSHHWHAPEIDRNGISVRLRGRTFVSSPVAYRLRMQISEDGGPYVNFGTLWWHRAE